MTDPADKTSVVVTPPLAVTIIGTGDGGVPSPKTGTIAVTPDHEPNLIVTVITPIMALAIRFVNVYIGGIVVLLTAAMTDKNVIPAPDFFHLFLKCAGLAIAGAVLVSLKDVITIFGKLEQKYPLLTGSV